MEACLSRRAFYTLTELETKWSVSNFQIRQWITDGTLQTCAWLPVMSVFHDLDGDWKLCHWEGYAAMSRHSCHRLFKKGQIYIRDFTCHRSRHHYKLPDTADSILIKLGDLLILTDALEEFEADNGLKEKHYPVSFDPTFRTVTLKGKKHQFGRKQAKVLRLFHDAAIDGEPWQNGKDMLRQAESECVSMSNLFKRNMVWREIIQSDERGYYRIHDYFLL